MSKVSNPILIIGGGLGGLSLAQGLKKKGIPFRIFERDGAASFRAQGYRIRLDERGIGSLEKLLPRPLFDLAEKTSSPVVSGGHRFDALTGEKSEARFGGGGPQRGTGPNWNVDRTVIRNVLLQGLEKDIDFGKRLERYEFASESTSDDKSVTARFADGTSATGRMIVGADGVRSHVRRQLVPGHTLLDTEMRAIFGKTPIPEGIPPPIRDTVAQGMNVTAEENSNGRAVLFSDTMRFDHGVDTSPAEAVQLPDDYIYWVLTFAKTRTEVDDKTLMTYNGEQSAKLAEELTKAWNMSDRTIVTKQDPDAASALFFLMARPDLDTLPTDARVTLLGDAAHSMPPLGGVGANSAFEDAAELADVLGQGEVGDEAIGAYDKTVRDRASGWLGMSIAGSTKLFGMRPIEELKSFAL
ncbi:cercosporin toxin biosynthesis protein [Exophiala viscosa]|uniref:Cercosporin toxin biosynthesis protein n=1 Tax=Exophiala viscosa TaxID=2486360 RepID=A0AAN6IB83_9EURO|nr:cercosporin toxin biosynthesis protein [Exophiala viscosa]KAI1628578.1 cercosporin toxin biosynthesis protein [Exophiala viscosa]